MKEEDESKPITQVLLTVGWGEECVCAPHKTRLTSWVTVPYSSRDRREERRGGGRGQEDRSRGGRQVEEFREERRRVGRPLSSGVQIEFSAQKKQSPALRHAVHKEK